MQASTWDELILDTAVVPEPVDDGRFRTWLSGQRLFVSSVMDAELSPYRNAVREYLASFGQSVPVMWETLSPEDCTPDKAFLNGVDRSTLFVLILGKRYGIADVTGYSPTHKEANRSKERQLPRLLFTLPAERPERDGKINDWLGGLYAEISGNQVSGPDDFVERLSAKLKDFAARAQRNWIKLGTCMFPGKVEMTSDGYIGRSFEITARAQDHRVRQALHSMGNRGGVMSLTWPNQSFPIQVQRVQERSEYANEAEIQIVCRTPNNWHGEGSGIFGGMTINGIGPEEITRQWAEYALFGKQIPANDWRNMSAFMGVIPDSTPLPQVLRASGATGWQAEGVARLYAVEETARSRAGSFSMLEVGPATSTQVRLDGELHFPKINQRRWFGSVVPSPCNS